MKHLTDAEYEAELAEYREMKKTSNERREEYLLKLPQRNLDIARLYYKEGLSLAKIGVRYGLSRARVHQILNGL